MMLIVIFEIIMMIVTSSFTKLRTLVLKISRLLIVLITTTQFKRASK